MLRWSSCLISNVWASANTAAVRRLHLPSMAKYAAAYADPQGPDDGRPTAQQLLADQGLSAGHLRGCAALVTGASGGALCSQLLWRLHSWSEL